MKKTKSRLISFILASSIFMTGCQSIDKLSQSKNLYLEYLKSVINDDNDFNADVKIEDSVVVLEPTNTSDIFEEPVLETKDYLDTTIEDKTEIIEDVTEPVEEVPTTSEVTGDLIGYAITEVNIRTGNNTDALILDTLAPGDSVSRILTLGDWDLVRYNNIIGYICNEYISYGDEFIPSSCEHYYRRDIAITNEELNFRRGPDVSYERISRFPNNTELQVLAYTDNGWLLVRYNDEIGYVHGGYVTSMLAKAQELYPELQLEELSVKKVVYSNTVLNVRSGGGIDFEWLSQLEKYESARVIAEFDEWYFIMTNEHNFGFINKSYTTELEDKYVIVDISMQTVYLYNEYELYYISLTTTGKDETPSDIGCFHIYEKVPGKFLTDYKTYNQWVDYWMPYNGGEGLHDATWRKVFGTEAYHTSGSHGCINLPYTLAKKIYNQVPLGTTVLVHK